MADTEKDFEADIERALCSKKGGCAKNGEDGVFRGELLYRMGRLVVRNPAACAAGGRTDGGARACVVGGGTDGGSLIADLEAYKKSLIFETVTGKREVA